jgi:hypothetical protein
MFFYICCIEVESTLIGRLIKLFKKTETSSGCPMAGRNFERRSLDSAADYKRKPGTQILSTGVFTHLIDATSSHTTRAL